MIDAGPVASTRDHLAARPRQIDVRVVVEVVHELVALQRDDLEVAVIPPPKSLWMIDAGPVA